MNTNLKESKKFGIMKATKDLRSLGLKEPEANNLIIKELVAAELYDTCSNVSLTVELFELFGEQHVEAAVEDAYYFLAEDEYELTPSVYLQIIKKLLESFRAEELILDISIIKDAIEKETTEE